MKKRNILFSLIVLASLTACHKNSKCKSYHSEPLSKTIAVSTFDKVDLQIDAEIFYLQGDEQSVTIEAPEKILEHISTTVSQGTFKIKSDKNLCSSSKESVYINITTPNLNEVDIAGSGRFMVGNLLTANNFQVNISGSGDFSADSISVNSFTSNISGSGDIYISGNDTILKTDLKISGSGDVDLINIPSSETNITIAGAGNCTTHTIDKLKVSISGSGDVKYLGNPIIDSNISGSGSLKQF